MIDVILMFLKNAAYGRLMFAYSDGRKAIGNRFQNYIETIVFQKSNKNILELD